MLVAYIFASDLLSGLASSKGACAIECFLLGECHLGLAEGSSVSSRESSVKVRDRGQETGSLPPHGQ